MTEQKTRQKTAIVIGAGVGGLSTAARLAKAGFTVTVLEKNNFTGGRCSLLHSNGHRFDQGPSLLLLPHLFHSTFSNLDTTLAAEGVELRKCEPNYQLWFGDGEAFRLSSDLAVMKAEVEKWEGKGGYLRYLDFLKEAHTHYELSVEHVLLKNFTSLWSMFRLDFLKELLRLHPFESIWTRAGKYFWTERLRRVFTFASMYMGMSPFDAPGTYSLLQYTELAEGIWYPVGGFHRVIQALEEVGKRLGVVVRLETAVQQILLSEDGSRVQGVRLENGETLTADVVVNNSDLVYAYNNLLPQTSYSKSLAERPTSCSSISFYWGLSKQVPELEAHNIFLADEYKESFDSIFKRHLIPDEPSFYVNVPSRIDASAAPQGRDSVVVLVPVGHLLPPPSASSPSSSSISSTKGQAPTPTQDWPSLIALARTEILATIATRTGVDLTPLITTELTNDPLSWRERFNLDRGAILGLSHSFFNVLCFRPSTRARRAGREKISGGALGTVVLTLLDALRGGSKATAIKGLYMVGASTHPGTGVPICLAGGKLVAEQVCEDLGVGVPWSAGRGEAANLKSRNGKGGNRSEKLRGLDVVERPLWEDSWAQWAGILWILGLLMGIFAFVVVVGKR